MVLKITTSAFGSDERLLLAVFCPSREAESGPKLTLLRTRGMISLDHASGAFYGYIAFLQPSFTKGWLNEVSALADTIKNFRNIAVLLIPDHRYAELPHELFVRAVVPVQETVNHRAWNFQLMSTIATLKFF